MYLDDLLVLEHKIAARKAILEELMSRYDLRISKDVNLFLRAQLQWVTNTRGKVTLLGLSQSQ